MKLQLSHSFVNAVHISNIRSFIHQERLPPSSHVAYAADIGSLQNSIGRLNVELRQSLSADLNVEWLDGAPSYDQAVVRQPTAGSS